MNHEQQRASKDQAADAWLEIQLEEELGVVRQPDLRHRVLASDPQRRAHAAQQVSPPGKSSRLLAAAIVLIGVATVIAVVQFADDDKPTSTHLQTPDPEPQPNLEPQPNPEPQPTPDPQPNQDPQPTPPQAGQELRAKSLKEFQTHAATATRISITADLLGAPASQRQLIEANRFVVAADQKATIQTELQTLQRLQPAGWKWSNSVRLDLPDGRFLTCAVYNTKEHRLGIRGLGDFKMTEALRALLAPLVEDVGLKTRLAGGSVMSRDDLLPGRPHSIPENIEQLTCQGLADEDLELLVRFKQLKTLDLTGCAKTIRGKGLSNLLMLGNLETLKMRYTQVSDRDMETVGMHGNLRHLDVSSHTQLEGVFLTTFSATGVLEELKMGWGKTLTDEGLIVLAKVDSLVSLDLSGRHPNEFTLRGFRELGRMKSLQSLTLDNLPVPMNQLLLPLGELTTLEKLRTTFTNVTTLSLRTMRAVHRTKHSRAALPLRSLDLTGCKELGPGILKALGEYLHLEELTLDRSSLRVLDDNGKPTSESFEDLQSLHKLSKLELNGLRLDANACKHIARLPSLVHLNLSFNGDGINDEALQHLSSATKIAHLKLSGCDNFTDAGLTKLAELATLKHLDLNTCDGFSAQGLDNFRRLRPNCELRLPSKFRPDNR